MSFFTDKYDLVSKFVFKKTKKIKVKLIKKLSTNEKGS
jgi:hypothetical protein